MENYVSMVLLSKHKFKKHSYILLSGSHQIKLANRIQITNGWLSVPMSAIALILDDVLIFFNFIAAVLILNQQSIIRK